MEEFNCQISSSSCSIPSEPPDIRNWFSSYKYESFVLDTCENFGGFYSEERESDKSEDVGKISREKIENFNGSREIRDADDEHESLNSEEVQDSLQSPSILSEPTDIRNWFSSYVYESPLLDTDDDLKSYVSRESECEKDDLVIAESIKDDLANSGLFQEIKNSCRQGASNKTCSTKLVKCSTSLVDRKNESNPLFSEPPHIGNWFPDYVYESPVVDTIDGFRDTLSIEESNEDKFAVGDSKREQENLRKTTKTRCRNEVGVGKEISNEFVKCKSSLRHDDQENKSINKDLYWAGGKDDLSWQSDECFKKILAPSLEVKQVRSSSINSNEAAENSSLNCGDSLSELGRADSGMLAISKSPVKRDLKSSMKLIDRKGSMKKRSETKEYQTDKVDVASPDQCLDFDGSTRGSNDKENEGKDVAENGFITTRKNKFTKTNDENCVRPSNILLQCSRNKGSNTTITTTTGGGGTGKDGVVKRKVLAETTNVNVEQCEANAKTKEITGKWRCPQKSKPPRGPPLKQLRLERWVHRV